MLELVVDGGAVDDIGMSWPEAETGCGQMETGRC